MKKIFSILTSGLLLLGSTQAATVTISNYNTTSTGLHGIADSTAALVNTAGFSGVMGRMTISDSDVALKVGANDIAGLIAAFQVFDPTATGVFALNTLGAGAFEGAVTFDTRVSVNSFGGSSVFVWLYKGATRAAATEYLLVKLNGNFPTDSEIEPPEGPIPYAVNVTDVQTLFAGTYGPQTHDYLLPGSPGPLSIYKMATIAPGGANFAPVAVSAPLTVAGGIQKSSSVTATDADDDTLTYAVVGNPSKASQFNFNTATGAFTYTTSIVNVGQTDSFTFRANDGAVNSNIGTISITIEAPPPNQAPVAQNGSDQGDANDLLSGFLSATDPDNNLLTFSKVSDPAHGILTVNADGSYQYMPAVGFTGSDSFTFKANDGQVDSNVATYTVNISLAVPQWTWVDGSSLTKQKGVYGNISTPAPSNNPGARSDAASTTSGALTYMFGGLGFGDAAGPGELNDLWMYDAGSGNWTWLGGGKGIKTKGTYGTINVADAANVPGGRSGANIWLEGNTKVWLFGGTGRDSSAAGTGILNDLWVFDLVSKQWTWVAGSNLINANGTYGTRGTAAAGNKPGARSGAVAWTGPAGEMFLFGGKGRAAAGVTSGNLNDLWKFDPATQLWTWMHGDTTLDAAGVYGSMGAGDSSTKPGARTAAVGWVNGEAKLWLFGGNGRAVAAGAGYLNDLWKYEVVTNQWTWVKGSTIINPANVYGTLGEPGVSNTPGGRAGAIGWRTGDGTMGFFGGQGSTGHFNDVWAFNEDEASWVWVKGPNAPNGVAVYGGALPPQGTDSTTPGARRGGVALAGATEDLLMFGGTNAANANSDLWKLDIPASPLASIVSIPSFTNTTVNVIAQIDPNGSDAVGKLVLVKLTDQENPEELDLGDIPAAGGVQTFNRTFSDLDPGTMYALVIQAENGAGSASSLAKVFTTTGVSPAIVSVAFVQLNSSVGEDDGAAQVAVTLTAPATVAFDVPFTLGGTAQPADYTAPATLSLHFVPGQIAASIGLGIKNDTVSNEGNETVVLNLQAPTNGVPLTQGGILSHTLTILDADALPVASGGGPQFARLGSFANFSVDVVSAAPVTYQWKKAGVNIAGATSATYIIPVLAKTDAASFSVVVTNPTGSDTENFDLFVVDYQDKIVVLPKNTASTTFASMVSSPKNLVPTYNWFKDDVQLVPAVTTASLKLTVLAVANTGEYQCRASFGSAMNVVVGKFYLGVTNVAPALGPVDLPAGHVGANYEYDVPITNLAAGGAPTSFTAVGLPTGLKISATGKITGIPTVLATNKAVVISAKNGTGTSNTINATISILPLPTPAIGTFVGVFERSDITGGQHGGRFDIAVTSGGKYTAKLTMGTAAALSATGQVFVSVGSEQATGQAVYKRTGMPSVVVDFALSTATPAPALHLTGILTEPATNESALFVGNGGCRNGWTATSKATDFDGTYNFSLRIPQSAQGDSSIPQGSGFGACTVTDLGVVTYVGRTADGGSFTVGSVLSLQGEAPFYASFPAGPASLIGVPLMEDEGIFYADMSWKRDPVLPISKERAYRDGFGPIDLTLSGGLYTAPANGTVVRGLSNTNNNAELLLARGNGQPLVISAFTFSILAKSAANNTQTVVLPAAASNPAKVTFKLDTKPLGQFSGTFTVPNAVPSLAQPGTFQGIIIKDPDTGFFRTAGFYLLAEPPQPGQTVLTSPLTSGEASFGQTGS